MFSRFFQSIGLLKKKVTVLVVGLDNSGKSTLIRWFKHSDAAASASQPPTTETIPTIGFNVDQFAKGKLQYTVFDMSGQERYRNLWEHYYPDADAIIFVVDTTDRVRSVVARDELEGMLGHSSVNSRSIPILVLANKSDLPDGLSADECSDILGLAHIKDKPWYICACSAIDGKGLPDGLTWLIDQLK